MMVDFSVSSVTTSIVSCPLPSPTPYLYSMCSEVTLQASQTEIDVTIELAQPFCFSCSAIIWMLDRFCSFTQRLLKPAREMHNFPHISQLAW